MADTNRTIIVVPAQQPTHLPHFTPEDAARKVAAEIIEGLLEKSLDKDDLFGRLCASLVIVKVRRGGQQ